jgi:peroxiredoxin
VERSASRTRTSPRFNLMGSSGRTYTLDDFVGKQEVVLIFYMGAG